MHQFFVKTLVLFALVAGGTICHAQDPPAATNDDTDQITAAIQSYVAAFNARDVDKLASHWSPEGVYTSRDTGEQVVGHEALKKEFASTFEGENAPLLAVLTESIDFISPNVALERGNATVTMGEEILETSYSVVYVKREGKWLIDRVTEQEIVFEVSSQEKLQPLEWLIGAWVDEIDGTTVEFNCQWTANQNYISKTFKVTSDEGVESSGLQIIGWDPVNEQIRSWLFDSDGSFVSGTWTQSEDQWVVQSVATLAEGSQGSYTSVYRPLEDGSVAWKKVNRVLDGELLPSIDEVIIQRQ